MNELCPLIMHMCSSMLLCEFLTCVGKYCVGKTCCWSVCLYSSSNGLLLDLSVQVPEMEGMSLGAAEEAELARLKNKYK